MLNLLIYIGVGLLFLFGGLMVLYIIFDSRGKSTVFDRTAFGIGFWAFVIIFIIRLANFLLK